MVKGIPVDKTINECDDLKEFQLVSKISGKYTCILHGSKVIKEKCIRIFASKKDTDAGVQKIHATTNRPAKISNSPEHCFIFNDEVNGVKVPEYLDKQWYVNLAYKRLSDFGVV
jgi:DNA polymerase